MADETTLEDDFRKDSDFLETLAAWFEKPPGSEPKDEAQCAEIAAELRSIAVGIGEIALNRQRTYQLENRVDDALCGRIESWLESRADKGAPLETMALDIRAAQVAATWLLCRRTESVGTKSMIGGGLGSIGAAAIASMFRAEPK